MRAIRIIPRLDVKGPNLVKGIRFEGLRVMGPPECFAKQYYEEGADEIIYMDIVASLYQRNNLKDIVERTAKEVFIPITVGGGIRSVEDIKMLLRAGADKIAINTAAIKNPGLIKEGAKAFGSQCIVVSIEAKKISPGRYEAFTDNGRQETGVDVFEWAKYVCQLGAGELLVTSVDREGTGSGYDIELISKIADMVPIPVIACGGAGRLEDIGEVVRRTNASAVAAASIFHYNNLTQSLIMKKYEEGNIEFLKKFTQSGSYPLTHIKQPVAVSELKSFLKNTGIANIRFVKADDLAQDQADKIKIGAVSGNAPFVVVVDYGCGNLFSIEHALKKIGANFRISSEPEIIRQADRLMLPGVGAFGDGMKNLEDRRLVKPIKEHAKAGKPLLGICLGMQLLLSESEEFGSHKGLDLIEGKVVRMKVLQDGTTYYKIPNIGWSRVMFPGTCRKETGKAAGLSWENTVLEEMSPGELMYFIHSYIVVPGSPRDILAETEYGGNIFCSVVHKDKMYGCQFHPERSGKEGLSIYRQFVFG